MNQLIEEFRLSLKPKEITKTKLKRLIKSAEDISRDNFNDTWAAYDIIKDKLPGVIKQTLEDAFMGPEQLGYQNTIELLQVVKMIVMDAVEVTRKEVIPFTLVSPNLFQKIHHDHDGFGTATVIEIIKSQIPEFHWEADVNWFDGYISSGEYSAFVELGWILPHKVRQLLDYEVRELWLFPYQESGKIAPYYFIVRKGQRWREFIREEQEGIRKEMDRIFS